LRLKSGKQFLVIMFCFCRKVSDFCTKVSN
jgi:hypothetical protein